MAVDYYHNQVLPESYYWQYVSPTGVVSSGQKVNQIKTFGDRKLGFDSPNWPTNWEFNDYFRSVYRCTYSPWHYSGFTADGATAYGHECAGFMAGESEPVPIYYNDERIALNNRIIEKLQDKIADQKVNIRVALAERRQTVNLVASTATRIASAFNAVKKGNFSGAARALTGNRYSRNITGRNIGGIPEQWLALKYGWQPLLGDLHGTVETLADLLTQAPPVLSAKASASAVLDDVDYVDPKWGYYPPVRHTRVKGEVRGRGYLEYKLSSALGQALGQTGLINPYSTAWELLPYSFVVDWFIPVGNYLTRLNFETGLVFSRGWVVSQVRDSWIARTEDPIVHFGGFTLHYSGGVKKSETVTTGRGVIRSSPPVLTPRFKDPYSLTHAANALSLLAVAFDRPKGVFDFMR